MTGKGCAGGSKKDKREQVVLDTTNLLSFAWTVYRHHVITCALLFLQESSKPLHHHTMCNKLHASHLLTSSVTNVGLRRVMKCLTHTTRCDSRALALILLVSIPLRHPLLKHQLQLQMMPLSHFAKLAIGHPRACLWIACNQRQRWYHCLCAVVLRKKAKSMPYACSACFQTCD